MEPSPPPPPLSLPTPQEYASESSSSRGDRNDTDLTRMNQSHTPTLYIPIAAPLTPLPSPKPIAAPQLPLSSSMGLGSHSAPSLILSSTPTSASTSASGTGAFTASDYPSLPPPHLHLHPHPSVQQQFSLDDALALFASIPTSPNTASSAATFQAPSAATTSQAQPSPQMYLQTPVTATYPHRPSHPTPFSASTTSSVLPAAPLTNSRRDFLAALLPLLTPAEMLFLSQRLAPLLKRDFLADLPAELGLLILSYVGAPGDGSFSSGSGHSGHTTGAASTASGHGHSHSHRHPHSHANLASSSGYTTISEPDVRSLVRAGMVSKRWRALARDEAVWRVMCLEAGFGREAGEAQTVYARAQEKERKGHGNSVGTRSARDKGKAKETDRVQAPQMSHSLSGASTSSASSYASTSSWISSMSSTRSSSPAPEEDHGGYGYDERNALSASTSTIVPHAPASGPVPAPTSSSSRLLSLSPSPAQSPSLPSQSHDQPSSNYTSSSYTHHQPHTPSQPPFSYRRHFRASWRILTAWRRGGALLAQHRLDGASGTSTGLTAGAAASTATTTLGNPSTAAATTTTTTSTGTGTGTAGGTAAGAPATATVTSLALDGSLVVVGLASSRMLLFSARTGVLVRTLRGHESGVWGVGLVSAPVAREGNERRDAGERQRKRRRIVQGTMEAPVQAQAWTLPNALRRAVGVPTRGRDGQEGLMLPGEVRTSNLSADESEDDYEDDLYEERGDGNGNGYEAQYAYEEQHEEEYGDDDEAREAADRAYARARRAEAAQQPFDHTYSIPGWGPASFIAPTSGSESGRASGEADSRAGTVHVDDGEDVEHGSGDKKTRGKKVNAKKVKRGALVVSGGCDKVIKVWDAGSGQCIYTLTGHTSTVRALRLLRPVPAFSPFTPSSNSTNLAAAGFPVSTPPTIDSRSAPLALTGARDATIRVWDIRLGYCVRVLEGHTGSVRCLDVWCGVGEEVLESDDANTDQSRQRSRGLARRVRQRRCVSGSYDGTCRLWDVDTGECIHVLRGHFSQIYSVAFDGVRVVSGGLDTTVRVWDADSGQCIALLQGHTALVCQLQLFRVPNASEWSYPPSPLPTSSSWAAASSSRRDRDGSRIALSGTADDAEYTTILATGGSDGRVITFSLATYTALHRIAAHDSSVTSMQLGGRFLVTAGNDGRVRLYEARGGGPPSHGRQESASTEALHPQQYYHNADAGTATGSDAAGNNAADANNGGFAFSPMHDHRARDAERGSRLGVYRYVRDLSSAGETVWKAAFGRDTLVLAGRKGGRGVVEVWTMDPRNKMVRLKGKVKDRDA
ncbi:hypothetical protein D9619_006831 [Psilocybe cf. subviscida]|uniref:F-box domain-containing protein n=1 Tax=Psilocybe cf. subviscida TaxID=2480587 RepID=A0A8H5B5B4_9AGAR|nr:hypothetical protein D9619_006831 [Psilocybe cf. subviscida]